MDNTRELLYHNAQLETELRHVKEQLSQANTANQYLLNRLSAPRVEEQVTFPDSFQKQYESAVRENVQLKAQLGLTPSFHPRLHISARPIKRERRDSLTGTLETTSIDPSVHAEDLLSFDEAEQSDVEAALHPTEDSLKPVTDRKQKEDFVGHGIKNPFSSGFFSTSTSTEQSADTPRLGRRQLGTGAGFSINYTDGTSTFIPTATLTPTSSFSTSPHLAREPPPFGDHEHMWMMGRACFLEDDTTEKRSQFWAKYARAQPRHTAEEYEEYYENTIRPAYWQKMAARDNRAKEKAIDVQAAGVEAAEVEANDLDKTTLDAAETNTNEAAAADPAHEHATESADVLSNSFDASLETVVPARDEQMHAVDSGPIEEVALDGDVPHQLAMSMHAEAKLIVDGEHAPASPLVHMPPKKAYTVRSMHGAAEPREPTELFAKPREPDSRCLRTVVICNIPPGTTLDEVLSHVRAGKILSASLHNTAGMRTTPPIDTNTAMVNFVSAWSASKMVTHWTSPLHTTISLLRTASRPIPEWVLEALRERNFSRVLFVYDHCHQWSLESVIEQFLLGGAKKPLAASYDPEADGLMNFEFASVYEAREAWFVVKTHFEFFGNVSRGFAADPCAPIRVAQAANDEADGEMEDDQVAAVNSGDDDADVDAEEDKVEPIPQRTVTDIEREQDAIMREG